MVSKESCIRITIIIYPITKHHVNRYDSKQLLFTEQVNRYNSMYLMLFTE